jgi:hypothetical protein
VHELTVFTFKCEGIELLLVFFYCREIYNNSKFIETGQICITIISSELTLSSQFTEVSTKFDFCMIKSPSFFSYILYLCVPTVAILSFEYRVLKIEFCSRGTHGYMAPEVLSKGTAYDSSADWFSFGCMLYKLLKGHSPFRQHKTKDKHEIDRMTLTMVS